MKFFNFLVLILFLAGCASSTFSGNKAITKNQIKEISFIDVLKIDNSDKENPELYFLETKGKILYSQSNGNIGLDYKVKRLLGNLLDKFRLRRHRKIYISLEISDKLKNKNKILSIAQDYILSHKKFQLANTDKSSLNILRKVLKREKDSIYKSNHNIKLRKSSDVILYISGDDKFLIAKLIAKNGKILRKSDIDLNKNEGWVKVKVPRNDGPAQVFEVMIRPVTRNEYLGYGGDVSVTKVSFLEANNYCIKKNAQLIWPYVFEYARRALAINRPNGSANKEIIAPYDDEDQDIYYQQGDKIESPDETMILFDWNSERYFYVNDSYGSDDTTFRCMRMK